MNCYAERMAARFAESGWSQGLINLRTRKWNGAVRLAPHKLAEPLGWKKPSTVFVNSMTDMFHEGYTNEQIAAVFGVMAATPQHTYQMLTKRAERMREWFAWRGSVAGFLLPDLFALAGVDPMLYPSTAPEHVECAWPLPNVWLGVSVESQDATDRIVQLLQTPAAVRFISAEPLLGHLDLTAASPNARSLAEDLDWIIAGCESGPGARPCEVEWLRSLRDQCSAAGVPYFLKQATEDRSLGPAKPGYSTHFPSVAWYHGSKRKGGGVIELPYLDGEQHAEFP